MKVLFKEFKKNILLFTLILIFLSTIFFLVHNYILKAVSKKDKTEMSKTDENEITKAVVNLTEEKVKIISKVSLPKNVLGITINGMTDKSNMEKILNLLDEYKIKAMFFLPTNRIAEEPDMALEIVKRGHTVGNYTLSQKKNFEELSIEEMMKEFSKANEVLEKNVGVIPEYFRCSNSKYSDQVLQVAENCNLSIAVPDFIKVNCSKIATVDQAKKYAGDLKDGNILSINLDNNNETLTGMSLLFKEITERKYKVLSIQELVDKNNIVYSNGAEDFINNLDNSKISNNNNVRKSDDYKLLNDYRLKALNNELKYKKSVKPEVGQKSVNQANINYGELYSNPIKGSGKVFSYAYTTSKAVALTFDGLGSKELVYSILDALDKSNIKATFFISGAKVEKDPEIALEILKRGHEIENSTLSEKDMSTVDYEKACKEIGESSEIIKEKLGIKTKYVRTKFGTYSNDFMLSAINTGNEVVTYSKNPVGSDLNSAEGITNYIKKKITRGEIICLNIDTNSEVIKAIPMIGEAVRNIGYDFVTIDKLHNSQYKRLSLKEIQGYDEIKINKKVSNSIPKTIYNLNQIGKDVGKTVAITFDDWGSDKTITNILNTLEKYNVKATFFIRSDGVVSNPNLAKAISDEGHDVASHTYSHLVINKTDPVIMQNDLVKGHQSLTYAIQRKPEMFFRPPQLEISDESLKTVGSTGYTDIIQADIGTDDYDPNSTKEEIITEVLDNSKSGSIIIFHMLDNAKGWEVLPSVIEGLKKQGYSFDKISDYIN